jgi:hypothetical protein
VGAAGQHAGPPPGEQAARGVERRRHHARRPARGRHFRGAIDSAKVVLAVRHFQRRFGRRLLLVWDRLNAHRSSVVRRFLAAHRPDAAAAYLPAYAPELNPEEQCDACMTPRSCACR